MYKCVSAFLQSRALGSRFIKRTVNIDNVRALMSDNRKVVLVLTHPAQVGEMSLDLSVAEALVYKASPTATVDQWLTSLGDASLPTVLGVPKVTSGAAQFNDAFAAKYAITKIPSRLSDDSQLPDSELRDLRLKKSGVDYSTAPETLLFTVNGLLHLVDASSEGIRIKEGGASTRLANRHNLGLISFKKVGKITCVPITADRISPMVGDQLNDGIKLRVPDYDLSNKIVMLSIGGYLQFNNNHYRVTGDHSVTLDWAALPITHRYFESRNKIDLSSFEETLDRNKNHGDALDLNQARSNESVSAYMTLSQSFLILIDADNIQTDLHGLEKTGLPGRFYAHGIPKFPLFLETGLIPSYNPIHESGVWSICVEENFINRYAHDTKPATADPYHSDAYISQYPQRYASGYFLEISTEQLVYPTA